MKHLKISTLICGGALALSLQFAPAVAAPASVKARLLTPAMQMNNMLAGTQWKLSSPNYAGVTDKPTLNFDNARLSASVGLNQMGGDYKMSGSEMTISSLFSTKMAGPPALMDAETQYAKALDGVRTFSVARDGQTLTLRGNQTLTFQRVGQSRNSPLASTKWQLNSPDYAGLDAKPTLQFSGDRLNASVGLNQINGAYSTSDLKLKVSPLASTRMAGPTAQMNAETRYSKALQSARSYEISRDGQTLTLRGDTTLQFGRVGQEQSMNDPLNQTQWTVSSPLYDGLTEAPTVRFENGRISASAGLNQLGGEYTATGERFRAKNLLSTQMAGSPAQMAAESELTKALNGASSFEISRDGNTLNLRGPRSLTLTRAAQNMNNPLTQMQWELTSPGYDGLDQKPTLRFDDNRLNASVGLNQLNGDYSTSAQNITVSPLASTRMAGPRAVMNAEMQYAQALQGARSYEVSADGKMLTLRGDTTLTFAAKGQMMNSALSQTKWQLATPTYAGTEKAPTLTFAEDSLGASVGLNVMGAGYKTDGNKISLEQFISTMMAGPPALMEAESQYSKALAGARTFEVSPDGQRLTLRGATTMVFTSLGRVATGFVPTETKIINVDAQLGPEFDGDKTPKYLQLEDLSQGVSWGRFTEPKILGFNYEPGNRYQMRVQVERNAQNGEKQLRLVEVLSQRYMAATQLGAGEKIMEVAPTKVDCVGVAPMKCLQVREVGGKWGNFYAPIEGFDFVEGYSYRLQVKESKIDNPPADGSSLRYQLVRVLDKTPVIY